MKQWNTAPELLIYLNQTYTNLHQTFEKLFWVSAMGDHSVNKKKEKAQVVLDSFRGDRDLSRAVSLLLSKESGEIRERLAHWDRFFSLHQVPDKAKKIKEKISALETKINTARAKRKEGYQDPYTKRFVEASSNAMGSLMISHEDERIRKACFDAREKLSVQHVADYVRLVALRNQYATILGYRDFYAYKLAIEEGMTKKDLFPLFDTIYKKTAYAFKNLRALEKKMPGLRKPWNFSFLLSGSFTHEEDPYFPFEEALSRWGQSFSALGIDYAQGSLTLDLLDRKGKYNNGFCHWPVNVYYDKAGNRVPGVSDFTCNVVLGTPGDAKRGYVTLFHEGGHAAHLLNADMKDTCVTSEYPPLSTAWAETQSMFLDTVFSSMEWVHRYAKTREGAPYPFELFERKVKQLSPLRPHGIVSAVSAVCEFEKKVYEEKNLTKDRVLSLARSVYKKHNDFTIDSYRILNIPHLYSWESACSYHGYGLATLALHQWREYFYKKYGYIVDNPKVGEEMKKVWRLGGSKTFPEFVTLATGKKLTADAYLASVTMSDAQLIKKAKERIVTLEKKPLHIKALSLNAAIKLVHGKKLIADNTKGFEAMAKKYAVWLKGQYPKKVAQKKAKK